MFVSGRKRRKDFYRSTLAGLVAGAAASWLMNVFISQLGEKITEPLLTEEDKRRQQQQQQEQQREGTPPEDATMKAAEVIVHTATSGRHLSQEGKQKGGPVVHYTFGTLTGGLYGAVGARWPLTTFGFGTVFGAALYAGADLGAVPALCLAPPATEQPLASQATPFAAHLVYGAATDLLRRLILTII